MKTILLIDDDPLIARLCHGRLRNEGFKVVAVRDGKAALDMLPSTNPDVVVLDLVLPGMSGLEVLRQIRSTKPTEHLPVIVLTNEFLKSAADQAFELGANICLSKSSCTPEVLATLVQQALGNAGETAGMSSESFERSASATIQQDLREEFDRQVPQLIADLRMGLQSLTKADPTNRDMALTTLFRRVHSLSADAAMAGAIATAELAGALDALLQEMREDPTKVNASTLRTVAFAVDYIATLLSTGDSKLTSANAHVLVVDDEALSRRAVTHSLHRVKLKSTAFDSAEAALQNLHRTSFDLAILDINLPGLDGLDLCRRIKAIPGAGRLPVIFVTRLADFETRAKSLLSGGNDLIAKPFVFMELGVKALIWSHRNQVSGQQPR